MTNTLLIPVDGSESARRALDYAIALKKQNDSIELTLLNVQQPSLYASLLEGLGQPFSMQQMLLEQGEAILGYHAQQLQEHDFSFSHCIKIGKPEDVICEYAKAHDVERIVMGKNGSNQTQYIFGSVAYPVVLGSPVPVTLIK